MPVNLTGIVYEGRQWPTLTFAEVTPESVAKELIDLYAIQTEDPKPGKHPANDLSYKPILIDSERGKVKVYYPDVLLVLAFGAIMAGQAEGEADSMVLASGSAISYERASKGDPVYELTGSVSFKVTSITSLRRMCQGASPLYPPIGLKCNGHQAIIRTYTEFDNLLVGLSLGTPVAAGELAGAT